jgi:predicted RNA-binding protein YlqC (UPF0109 family)
MENNEKLLQTIIQRLNILIAIELNAAPEAVSKSTTQRVRKLAELGLAPAEIGAIIGKKANYISAVLGQRRRNLTHA